MRNPSPPPPVETDTLRQLLASLQAHSLVVPDALHKEMQAAIQADDGDRALDILRAIAGTEPIPRDADYVRDEEWEIESHRDRGS